MTSTKQALEITSVTPSFGARVDGLEGKQPLDDETVAALQAAIQKYKVLFLTDQHLNEQEQSRLASYFGTPYEDSSRIDLEYAEAGLSDVSVVAHFHSDVMYSDQQPAYAMLQMLRLPDEGGDTMWADLVSGYEALSEPLRDMIDGLTAVNVHPEYFVDDAELSRRYNAKYGRPLTAEELEVRRHALRPHEHPIVRVIPETGRKNYWISAQHTHRIAGLSKDESDAILGLLFKHQLRPEFVIRWRWHEGDIAFWDHRTTLHAGVSDYDKSQTRQGRRANIQCVSPIPAKN